MRSGGIEAGVVFGSGGAAGGEGAAAGGNELFGFGATGVRNLASFAESAFSDSAPSSSRSVSASDRVMASSILRIGRTLYSGPS